MSHSLDLAGHTLDIAVTVESEQGQRIGYRVTRNECKGQCEQNSGVDSHDSFLFVFCGWMFGAVESLQIRPKGNYSKMVSDYDWRKRRAIRGNIRRHRLKRAAEVHELNQ